MTSLTGTPRLIRLALRRDRVLLPVWIAALTGVLAAVVSTIVALYTTEEERLAAAMFTAASPVARMFDGPASGTDIGALAIVESFVVLAVLAALMSAQAVVRHTRQEEETGRAEMIGSAVVGRHAPLTAALAVAIGANLVLAGAVMVTLLAFGLGVSGSIATGLALAGVGVSFAAVAGVTAQLAETQRGANGMAAAVLGIAFLLRAVGDGLGEVADSEVESISAWPSWLSPIGWGQQVRPYHQDNWDVLVLFGLLTVGLVVTAFVLTVHRDFGAGMRPVRPGPARAGRWLAGTNGLAWRLQRGVLVAWTVGMATVAAALGSVGDGISEFATTNEQLLAVLEVLAPEGALEEAFFVFMMGIAGVAVTGYTVQALLRLRAEEAGGRLEPVLATPAGRTRWITGHLAIAAGGTVLLMVVVGAASAIAYGLATGRWAIAVGGLMGAALVQVPAALALGGFVVAAFAVVPRWVVPLGWGALVAALLMGQLGALLDLPQAVLNVSPFTHVPRVPAEELALLPVGLLVAVAAGLGGLAIVAFRRRDLAIGA